MIKPRIIVANLLLGFKTRSAQFLNWLKASRKHQVITAVVVTVLLASSAAVALVIVDESENSTTGTENSGQSEQKRILRVESNIPGITMSATPKCDDNSNSPEFKTPSDCTLAADQSEVTVTAPAQSVIEGNTYIFKSWDGCSASNEDWKICKVIIEPAGQTKLTANYLPLSEFESEASSAPGSSQPNTTDGTSKPKNLREQCESSKVSSADDNSVRCTVASDALFLGFDWSNDPEPSPQPPITIKCLESNKIDCKVSFKYASAGIEPVVIKRGTSFVVNSSHKIGGRNPGPSYPSHTISGTSSDSTQSNVVMVTLSAPLSHAVDGDTYQFVNYSIYVPSYQRAGTSSDYFNWIYDKP